MNESFLFRPDAAGGTRPGAAQCWSYPGDGQASGALLGELPAKTVIPTFLGVDTYSLDGNKVRDWKLAKSSGGAAFAIFAANWGTFPGGYFKREWPRMKDAGLVRGAYIFLRFPNPQNDRRYGPCPPPVDQAKTFIKTVGKLDKSDLPPSLDVEFPGYGRATTGLTARQCLDRVREAWKVLKDFYGAAPMIYTSARVWHEDLSNLPAPDLVESPLWLAYYPFRKGPAYRGPLITRWLPPVPPPWGDATNWWVHQYQGDALRFPGFATGNVDLNRFHAIGSGDAGDQVKWAQRRLGIAQTGRFDQATQAAVTAFRRKNGLPENAIIDPATFAYLCWANV
jgi:GH25 family lysozyme M1 (1,4-beta-N-acetylmuramidase)